MSAGDSATVSTLRLLKNAIYNEGIAKKKKGGLSEPQVMDVLGREAKKLRDSITAYTAGGRPELAAKEQTELHVLERYMPEQLTEDEITKIVQEAVGQYGSDFRKVMAQVMPKVKGRADGTLVAQTVKTLTSGS